MLLERLRKAGFLIKIGPWLKNSAKEGIRTLASQRLTRQKTNTFEVEVDARFIDKVNLYFSLYIRGYRQKIAQQTLNLGKHG